MFISNMLFTFWLILLQEITKIDILELISGSRIQQSSIQEEENEDDIYSLQEDDIQSLQKDDIYSLKEFYSDKDISIKVGVYCLIIQRIGIY